MLFWGSLITKLSDDSKHEPLSGVEFLLTDSSGNYLGNDNGRFTTNAAGEILVDGLEPGMTVIAREVRAKTGYLLDDSPQHALIKSGETVHLQFLNQPAGNLIIRKVSSGPNRELLEGVEFKITYADGSFVPDANGELSSNGIYYTNKSGEIRISGIVGTVVATETKTIPGYTIDEATRTQTVVVNPNDTQTLTFYNKPTTTLILQKYISGTKNEPLSGVQFLVTDSSGAVVGPNNGYYTTDSAGQIVIEGLTDGMTVTAKEVKSVDGFVLDGTPQSIKIDQSQSPQRMTSGTSDRARLLSTSCPRWTARRRWRALPSKSLRLPASSSPTKTEKSAPTVCTIPTKTGRSFSRASPAHWWQQRKNPSTVTPSTRTRARRPWWSTPTIRSPCTFITPPLAAWRSSR